MTRSTTCGIFRLRDGRRSVISATFATNWPKGSPRSPSAGRSAQCLPTPDPLRVDRRLYVGSRQSRGRGDRAHRRGTRRLLFWGDQRIRGDDGYLGDDEVAQRASAVSTCSTCRSRSPLPKPVLAMVAGYAIGAVTFSISCAICRSPPTTPIRPDRARVGSFDGGYGSSLLARTIGLKRAKEVWFLCRQYDAPQALEWGLVNTVVP